MKKKLRKIKLNKAVISTLSRWEGTNPTLRENVSISPPTGHGTKERMGANNNNNPLAFCGWVTGYCTQNEECVTKSIDCTFPQACASRVQTFCDQEYSI